MDDKQISRLEKKYNIEISEPIDIDDSLHRYGRLDRAYRIYDREDKTYFTIKVRNGEFFGSALRRAMGDI